MITDQEPANIIFCQLNEYSSSKIVGGQWSEKYRWIKFEEMVEESGEHWSKPHVGIHSLSSIQQLRKLLTNGVYMFDPDGDNIDDVFDETLNKVVASEKIFNSKKDEILYLLKKNCKRPQQLNIINKIRHVSQTSMTNRRDDQLTIPEMGNTEEFKFSSRIKKVLSPNAEVVNILVTELDVIQNTFLIFIRLKTGFVLGNCSEVDMPTKFIIIIFGSEGTLSEVRECGRVMGSMFVDNIFRINSYAALSTSDVLGAFENFVNNVLVIPASEWNPTIRIDPPKDQTTYHRMSSVDAISEQLLRSDPFLAEKYEEIEGLEKHRRLFRGLVTDVQRKMEFYLSDYKDGLHPQCLASFIFLYFACFAPIVTYGGLLMKATDGFIGTNETILAGAIAGVLFALFAGQPLNILGCTGPLLVIEGILFRFCEFNKIDFLVFRVWIGFWIMLISLIFVAFNLSFLVKYITKFTEESYAMLISLIYIYQAIEKLFESLPDFPVNSGWTPDYHLNRTCVCIPPSSNTLDSVPHGDHLKRLLKFERPPLLDGYQNITNTSIYYYIDWKSISDGYFSWETHDYKEICVDYGGHWEGNTCGKLYVPDIFIFSWILMLGTFTVALGLQLLRNSRIFPNWFREIVSNFAVVIAIGIFSVMDYCVGLHTQKLKVPSSFEPTLGYGTRGWIINPLSKNPWWTIPVAIFPAMLATIVIFMDHQITAVIVNRKQNKLKKSFGYHLDFFIIGLLVGLNSLLGIPWFVAATVQSMNHIMSLKIESSKNAPGQRPIYLGCREQRITNFLISLTIGLSVLLMPVLKKIPMAVLYGVFLYMGVSPLKNIEFFQRLILFFYTAKNRPDYSYLRYIPIMKVHIFTLVQLFCFIILWVIKSIKILSIGFPLMVFALCFIRKSLECYFSYDELVRLDCILPGIDKSEDCAVQNCFCLKSKNSTRRKSEALLEKVIMDTFNDKDT